MRTLFLASILLLAACSGAKDNAAANEAQANQLAAAQRIPPPKTPVLKAPVAPGNEASWIAPVNGADDPKTAPYGNVLDEPVVNAPSRSR